MDAASAAATEASLVAYAHDIRTALTGILALSELLATSTIGERERRWADGIKGSAEHLSSLTTLMIDAAQAQGGVIKLRDDVFDLRELITAVANSLSARAETKNLVTEVAVADDLPERVRGDVVRLRAALENLIDNAVKFTERGKVRLELGVEPAKRGRMTLAFSLSDTGIGLKPGEIHRLFRPFTQANADIARRYGGTGLGLVVVKALAKRMGGDLTVTSAYGEGSTFRFAVQVKTVAVVEAADPDQKNSPDPDAASEYDANVETDGKSDPDNSNLNQSDLDNSARDAKSDAGFARDAKRNAKFALKPKSNAKLGAELKPAILPPAKPPAPRLSVLCVEDNPYGRVILNTLLTELGHRADFASTGEEAVAAMTRAYEAVLMDMTLPGIDGLEATRRIRTLAAPAGETPIIGISGRSEPGDEAAAQAAGINAYLRKPLSPKALSDALAGGDAEAGLANKKIVIAGLDPAIHADSRHGKSSDCRQSLLMRKRSMDRRVKPGDDERWVCSRQGRRRLRLDQRFDPLGVRGRRRIVDHHAEIGPAIDCKGGIFERDRPQDRMAQMLDAAAVGADVVVAPHRREFGALAAESRPPAPRPWRQRRRAPRRRGILRPRTAPRSPNRTAPRAPADRRR